MNLIFHCFTLFSKKQHFLIACYSDSKQKIVNLNSNLEDTLAFCAWSETLLHFNVHISVETTTLKGCYFKYYQYSYVEDTNYVIPFLKPFLL